MAVIVKIMNLRKALNRDLRKSSDSKIGHKPGKDTQTHRVQQ